MALKAAWSEAEGLGLLDVETVMEPEKTVRNSTARSVRFDEPLSGYEIHLGRTTGPDCVRPAIRLNGKPDGATSADGKVFGCYLHGLFGAAGFRPEIPRRRSALKPPAWTIAPPSRLRWTRSRPSWKQHLDVDAILATAR